MLVLLFFFPSVVALSFPSIFHLNARRLCPMDQLEHDGRNAANVHMESRVLHLRGGSQNATALAHWPSSLFNQTGGSSVNHSRTPLIALQEMVGKEVVVALDNGTKYKGRLLCADPDFTVWLEQVWVGGCRWGASAAPPVTSPAGFRGYAYILTVCGCVCVCVCIGSVRSL